MYYRSVYYNCRTGHQGNKGHGDRTRDESVADDGPSRNAMASVASIRSVRHQTSVLFGQDCQMATGMKPTRKSDRLAIVPCSLKSAKAYILEHHRHHLPPLSGLFAVAVEDESGTLRGVAIVGRPVARGNQDGYTAEVTRTATDGCKNACSALLGACWRAARALGYRRLVTYTLASETGGSLRAAGWKNIGQVTARSWSCPSRPRVDRLIEAKERWELP